MNLRIKIIRYRINYTLMKKLLIILLMSIGLASSGYSQEAEKPQQQQQQADGGKLKALQIAYLTNKLNLKPEEAERFWPVFNQYQDEIRKVRIEGKNLTEVDKEQKILDIRKKYFDEFSKVLNRERADRVFKADNEFKDVIRKEIQERRQLNQERRAGGIKQ
jgi:hypothetical protein